jgi:hypothetical protein
MVPLRISLRAGGPELLLFLDPRIRPVRVVEGEACKKRALVRY